MVDSDQLENDPFFRMPAGSDWNACIGKQGTEENYLEGYTEAAMARHRCNMGIKRLYSSMDLWGF